MEKIEHNNRILAIIVRSGFKQEDMAFFSETYFPQQLGYMNRPEGYEITPHRHNVIIRQIDQTQEVLFIKSGKVRVDFYDNDQSYIESLILSKGDIILLASGGHGFKMLEPTEIIEVKQGPYAGEKDKIRFEHVNENNIILKKEHD